MHTGMKISDLTYKTNATLLFGEDSGEVLSLCCDSRKVREGDVFIALKGTAVDGKQFVEDARAKEAAAAIYTDRAGLAIMADRFYDHPSGKLRLVGITGTNGKTTTVTLLYHLFRRLGYECGLLSTIANYVGTTRLETTNTTADPLTINQLLAQMVERGCQFCFMEVSSIGVDQHRVDALEFAVGIFSNLTHDHLDYHGTFAEYLRCKKAFFDSLPSSAVAITNIDDRNGSVMVQNTKARVVTYSCHSIADHSCKVMEQTMEGSLLEIDGVEFWSTLIGEHNAYNLLAIYSTAVEMGAERQEVIVAMSALKEAPGRLETIHGKDGKTIVIDYAHTPDALENVLKTLRKVCHDGQIVCVFGCGGDRDRTKRPEMAQIAEKYADSIIVTSDNSRTESTQAIIEEICTGFSPAAASKVLRIADRKEAIRAAMMFSKPGATILLAGKGHENYQIIGTEKLHFDEREIVEEVLKSC